MVVSLSSGFWTFCCASVDIPVCEEDIPHLFVATAATFLCRGVNLLSDSCGVGLSTEEWPGHSV
jgi:hypothetical protein